MFVENAYQGRPFEINYIGTNGQNLRFMDTKEIMDKNKN